MRQNKIAIQWNNDPFTSNIMTRIIVDRLPIDVVHSVVGGLLKTKRCKTDTEMSTPSCQEHSGRMFPPPADRAVLREAGISHQYLHCLASA